MALSQDSRISISKKIVSIPKEINDAIAIKAILNQTKTDAQKKDDANKSLSDNYTTLINSYQSELTSYDGNVRTQLTEQMFLDSGNHKQGNYFYPNQPLVATPGLPTGVYLNFPPYSKNVAIGKKYSETYDVTTKESDLITIINASIATLNSYSNIQKSTGQSCGSSGTCDLPLYTTQTTCEAATPTPGIWTSGPDLIADDPIVQAASNALITAVANWKTYYLNTQAIINAIIDTNSIRNSGNITTSGQITTINAQVLSWQALPTFDTNHHQTTCISFNAYDVSLLSQTKYRNDGLYILQTAIAQRNSNISSRQSALNTTYLGSITQATDGTITTAIGLYGSRFRIIDMRLNLMSGTMPAVLSVDMGMKAQDQAIASANSGLLAYADIMKSSMFSAPSIGANKIHLVDVSIFTVNDNVFIVADGQSEITATITAIDTNLVTLNAVVPAKYLDTSFARCYKDIS